MTRTRLLASLVMAPVAVFAVLLLSTPWLLLIAALLMMLVLWEWFGLAEVHDTLARSALLVAHLALMVAIVWASHSRLGPTLVLYQLASLVGVIWWLLALLWMQHFNFASNHDSHARMLKLAAGALAVIPAWCAVAWIHAEQPGGHRWLLVALAAVWAADSGAYFAGRRFGRRKLCPTISPNKTVEGMAGGLLAALLVGLAVATLLAGASLAQWPAIAIVVLLAAGASVVGDLFESLLKRHVGVKDSGYLIPGHGGILDRLDGVLAALPVFAVGKAMAGF